MLFTEISNLRQSGKSTLLADLARGALICDKRVLYMSPSMDNSKRFAKVNNLSGLAITHYHRFLERGIQIYRDYDYILIDDCDCFKSKEGKPNDIVRSVFRNYSDIEVSVICTINRN